MKHNTPRQVARIENRFIFHAQYKLSPREQKLILYLIANMDNKEKRFYEQTVTVRELEKLLKKDSKKWGGLYKELTDLTKRIRNKGIEFDTSAVVDGQRFPGYINWFQSVTPMENENGEVAIRFLFSEDLKPFLIDLSQYARINYAETAQLRSGFSIRMFQIFQAHRGKMRAHEKRSELAYLLVDLKKLLGLEDKYPDFRNFRRRVLNLVDREINEHTSIELHEIKFGRSGTHITSVTFVFSDKEDAGTNLKNFVPKDKHLDKLTRAQLKAYEALVKFGVEPGIAYKQLLPKVTSSEFLGFEDWYFEEVLKIFKVKGKQGVGAFVNWFLTKKVFEQGDQFAKIMERIQARKKKLQMKEPDVWDNRMLAKGKTDKEFSKAYRSKES